MTSLDTAPAPTTGIALSRPLRALLESGLSVQEIRVVDAIADGLSREEAALQLSLAVETVKSHLSRMGVKVGCGSRAGLVGFAYRKGLLVRCPALPVEMTPRQRELLPYIGRGSTNAEIALQLELSFNTVKTHVSCLMERLEARTRAHLVRRGVDTGALLLWPRGGAS